MNELALFNKLFDDFGDDYIMPSFNIKKAFPTPKVDVEETKDSYLLKMDLPGKTDKDVKVELNHNILTISSEEEFKKEEKEDKKDKSGTKYLLKERTYSQFSRSFTLPDDVDSDKLSAAVKNGVLTVSMPRKEISAPKKIAIQCA